MKLLTPTIKDCKYIHKKLRAFFDENAKHPEYVDKKELDRALKRLCDFFKLPIPRVVFYNGVIRKYERDGKTVNIIGECTSDGLINLIHPAFFKDDRKGIKDDRERWIEVFYHEFGHYVLWADAEIKAELFADRMMEKWRKKR